MKKKLLVKTLALSIIVLFIGVSFQPAFAVDIKPTETDIESKSGNDEKMDGGFENRLCFVEGETAGVSFLNPLFSYIALMIIGSLFELDWAYNIRIRSAVFMGSTYIEPNSRPVYYYPAYGWIYTNGTNGVKYYSGYFYGNINGDAPQAMTADYRGISGFTGIVIHNSSWIYYKGYALRVAITPGEPYHP